MILNGNPHRNPELNVGAEGWLDADPDRVKINGEVIWLGREMER
jgi:hypothetical protein